MELTPELITQLIQATLRGAGLGNEQYRHDLPAGFTTTTNFVHGPMGIFGGAGLDRDIFSTRIHPQGLLSVLPAHPANDTNPVVGYLTGITAAESGAEQEAPCDDPLDAGNLKSCRLGATFGRVERGTSPLDITEMGERVNRGEFYDLRLVNDPLLDTSFALPGVPTTFAQALRNEVLARYLTLGAAFEDRLGPMVWNGNPLNNTAGGGYMEFSGFESLITNTIVDVLNQTSCPSLASDVKNANYAQIETDPDVIYEALTMIFRYVRHNARSMGFNPVRWIISTRGDLFNQLADYWPCVYNTKTCFVAGGALNNAQVDASAMREMGDRMRERKFLRIDAVDIPVVEDDYVPEKTNVNDANVPAGKWASDIYFIPLTVQGGREVTYFEYFNFDGMGAASDAIQAGGLGPTTRTSDGGRFVWTVNQTNYCFKWLATIRPRLRLLTPFLAGRLQNVMYAPLQHLRNPRPGDAYHVNGGNQTLDNAIY